MPGSSPSGHWLCLGFFMGQQGAQNPQEDVRALTPPDGEEEAPGGLLGRCRVCALPHAQDSLRRRH